MRAQTQKLTMPNTSTWSCKSCGCTDDRACHKGCSWVRVKICSTCATPEELFRYELALRMGQKYLIEILNDAFTLPDFLLGKTKGRHTAPAETVVDSSPKGLKTPPARHYHPRFDRQEILNFLKASKPSKVLDVAKKFTMEVPTARNALEQLVDSGLARKEKSKAKGMGRKPFLYYKAKP